VLFGQQKAAAAGDDDGLLLLGWWWRWCWMLDNGGMGGGWVLHWDDVQGAGGLLHGPYYGNDDDPMGLCGKKWGGSPIVQKKWIL
jgi:hypothetical protein